MKHSPYNQRGLVTDKPINLRLMPEELQDAERIAAAAGISKSKLARTAYLKGLHLVCQELSLPLPTAGTSGGEAVSASPADFSNDK